MKYVPPDGLICLVFRFYKIQFWSGPGPLLVAPQKRPCSQLGTGRHIFHPLDGFSISLLDSLESRLDIGLNDLHPQRKWKFGAYGVECALALVCSGRFPRIVQLPERDPSHLITKVCMVCLGLFVRSDKSINQSKFILLAITHAGRYATNHQFSCPNSNKKA